MPLDFVAADDVKLRMTSLAGSKKAWKFFRIAQTHFLYVLFDHHDKILYIGETNEIGRRIRQHEKAGKFFNYFGVIEMKNREAAIKLESKMIREFRPILNLQQTPWTRK